MALRPTHSRVAGLSAPAAARRRSAAWALSAAVGACAMLEAGCGDLPTGARTVDLGDNFEAPDRSLDEDFFHCVIQPEVLSQRSCAMGNASDGGGCHLERSALRLEVVDSEPRCDGDVLLGSPTPESQTNLDRVRATVGVDAEASPFYRRPLGLDSHPRVIFDEGSEEAALIREWIDSGLSG